MVTLLTFQRPHKRNARSREDPAVKVDSDGAVGNADWGLLDASWSDGRDEVEGAHGVDAAIGVVEVDLEVSGGLLDIEEQQMAMQARDGLVGVRDGYGFGCVNEALADVGGVGLTRLLGRTSNCTLFPVDGKAK